MAEVDLMGMVGIAVVTLKGLRPPLVAAITPYIVQ